MEWNPTSQQMKREEKESRHREEFYVLQLARVSTLLTYQGYVVGFKLIW